MKDKYLSIRFYAELNDFLKPGKRFKRFNHTYFATPTVKDIIETMRVPHAEVDLILVNGKSVGFEYKIQNHDDIAVYPVFESIDIKPINKLRPEPLREVRFIVDINLGRLARYLRMLGFDTLYQNDYEDKEIVDISLKEKRIILTRDQGLLKRRIVLHGYWVRNTKIMDQIQEVVQRFDLTGKVAPFSRCMDCNGSVAPVEKSQIVNFLKEGTRQDFKEFFQCQSCDKVYWKGSHNQKMMETVSSLRLT